MIPNIISIWNLLKDCLSRRSKRVPTRIKKTKKRAFVRKNGDKYFSTYEHISEFSPEKINKTERSVKRKNNRMEKIKRRK